MLEPADFQTLFAQLQSRYPASSLTAELVQVHAGHFVVRACVHVGGQLLATSLAAAATVELAEDQARLRVLRMLGVGVTTAPGQGIYAPETRVPSTPPNYFLDNGNLLTAPLEANPLPDTLPQPLPQDATFFAAASATLPLEPVVNSESSRLEPSLTPELELPDQDFEDSQELPPDEIPLPEVEAAPIAEEPAPEAPTRPTKARKAAVVSEPTPAPEAPAPPPSDPLDLTPLFLQIEDEMERIGWTKEQGRIHLKRTYGKRSRQQLTDEELVDFLAYLKSS